MARIKQYPIPFDENGNLISVIRERRSWRPATKVHVWQNNVKFYASLKHVGIDKGSYSDRMVFEDQDTGKRFNMHMNDFINAVQFMRFGILQGTFCYARSYGKYGVRFMQ